MEAGVHEKNLWLAFGTGNMNKIALVDKNEGDNIPFVENRVYGIRDKNFPNFIDVKDSDELNKLNSGYENGLLSIKNCSEGGKHVQYVMIKLAGMLILIKIHQIKQTKMKK